MWGAELFFNLFSGACWLFVISLAIGIAIALVTGPLREGEPIKQNEPGAWWKAIATAIVSQLIFPIP